MKIAATLMAVSMALSMAVTIAPSAAASNDLYTKNLEYLTETAKGAPLEDLQRVATFVSSRGVTLEDLHAQQLLNAPTTNALGVGGVHVGDGWHECIRFFFFTPIDCQTATGDASGQACLIVEAHWALYVYTPEYTKIANGVGGEIRFDTFWTELHATQGFFGSVVNGPPVTVTGSGCILANSAAYVFTVAVGVHQS